MIRLDRNPMDECPDDTRCWTCGEKLPDDAAPGTWAFNGFCNVGCAARSPTANSVDGKDLVLQLARYPGRYGGPGFEDDVIREWIEYTQGGESLTIKKIEGDIDARETRHDLHAAEYRRYWAWRVYDSGRGVCLAFRLTGREL